MFFVNKLKIYLVLGTCHSNNILFHKIQNKNIVAYIFPAKMRFFVLSFTKSTISKKHTINSQSILCASCEDCGKATVICDNCFVYWRVFLLFVFDFVKNTKNKVKRHYLHFVWKNVTRRYGMACVIMFHLDFLLDQI